MPQGFPQQLPRQRRSGILLHPTALTSDEGEGVLGRAALDFIDFLAESRVAVWQMLPIHPVHADRSPYQTPSLFAGGEHLICTATAARSLEPSLRHAGAAAGGLQSLLRQVVEEGGHRSDAFEAFCAAEADWLDTYAAFRVLRNRFARQAWQTWPAPWRDRPAEAVFLLRRDAAHEMEAQCVAQFLFQQQWDTLRARAAARGITLFGDLPMFPAVDSAEVWAEPQLFLLDAAGQPIEAAGAPPDQFAPQGQRWGGAVYDWPAMAANGYRWWARRLARQSRLFDMLRLDHFRGFQAWWSIPAGAADAGQGRYLQGPGGALFERLGQVPDLAPLIAEDLGNITPDVEALRQSLGLPGIRVLQFGFDGSPTNPHLPANITGDSVYYSGTHDNDTSLGWWRSLDTSTRQKVLAVIGGDAATMPWPIIQAVMESAAGLAIVPLQDILGLGSEARFNRPGTVADNWIWQLSGSALGPAIVRRLVRANEVAGRD